MKAVVSKVYGKPRDVIEVKDYPTPVPKDDEVLIQIHYAGVNRTDCGFIQAKPFVTRFFTGLIKPRYPILGCEYSGVIVECGSSVKNYKIGDRVFGFDDSKFGAHAEYVAYKETSSFNLIPEGVDYMTAAMGVEGSHYALSDIKAVDLKNGSKVMVNGGTGAIGSAAFQILNSMGCDVTVTCDTDYIEKIRNLGATKIIDYLKEDFTQIEEKFDFVFDAVGKSSFGKCKPIMKDNAVYISTELGPNAENPFLGIMGKFQKGKRVLFPIPTIDKHIVKYLGELLQSGKFKPLLDRVYEMDEIVDAYEYVLTGQKKGNVLVKIA
jgi:NADPH:quinone reductase-like Zn-dependent oxidoreductase